jgi:anti-sigma factor RsiW
MVDRMTCHELHDQLPDLVDGTIDESVRDAIDEHLASCESCRVLVADLRRVRQAAALLERPSVPSGAWNRLATRLRDEGIARPAAASVPRSRPSWAWIAVAAVLLLAVGAALYSVKLTIGSTPAVPVRAGAPGGNASPSGTVESVESELQLAASHYENAIKGLEQIANASDSPLDPIAMATLKENLAVIDKAIDESRVALRNNPQSQVAQENLFEAFRRKVGLLQDTIALMNEMRKGDQAGAARIVEGLNKS